jgi:hypothetical protein
MLIAIHRSQEGVEEPLLSGTLWLEGGRIAVQGVEESTAAVKQLVPEQIPELGTKKLIGPDAGERFLISLPWALIGPTVWAEIEYPHPDACLE